MTRLMDCAIAPGVIGLIGALVILVASPFI